MAPQNDENTLGRQVFSTHYQYKPSPLGLKASVQPASSIVLSTAAAHNSSCLGVLAPQALADSLERQLAAAHEQIELEQCKSSQLQLRLQQAQRQLQHQKHQLACSAAREADLKQQVNISNKQLQQALESAAAAKAANLRAARDCNQSAGIALKQVAHVQQLRQVVKQQALQLSSMQRQLHEVTMQLDYSRKLHAHTAALLSVREMQLAELQDGNQQNGQHTAAQIPPSSMAHKHRQLQEIQQQHTGATAGCAALDTQGAAGSKMVVHDIADITAAGQDLNDGCASECSIDSSARLSLQAESGEQGTSTPITTHPARPARPAVHSSSYRSSRLSLVDHFNAAAAVQHDQCAAEVDGAVVGEEQGSVQGVPAEAAGSKAQKTSSTVSRKMGAVVCCRWLRSLLRSNLAA